MKRPNRRLVHVVVAALPFVVCLFLTPIFSPGQENKPAAGPKRPHTDSRTPFVHRIQVRDETDNPFRPTAEAGKEGKGGPNKLIAINKTCGKCHDYATINTGWHFNMADPNVNRGRPGEPWILTDEGVLEDLKTGQANTRTQLPLSYRGWPGTWKPADVGMNDWKFAYAFARQHPGGGILETSKDQRFAVTGNLQNDCLICHIADNNYDLQARYDQIVKKQNFKYATLVAAGVGSAEKSREKLKDTWTPPDPSKPDAGGPSEPSFEYDMGRFNPQGLIHFDITRRVPNERCYSCHTSLDMSLPAAEGLKNRWKHDGDIHLVKGMLCVDCHRHGLDHMVTRGYEGEAEERKDHSIKTLTCAGCHYGPNGPTNEEERGRIEVTAFPSAEMGGRKAAPRPVHKGLPTLHFDVLSCTACHSGPFPGEQATRVLTSMAHRLGTESYNRAPEGAPTIEQPVFLRVKVSDKVEKIVPHKMMYPTFWGRQNGDVITPISPDLLNTKALQKLFGPKPSLDLQAPKPLTEEEIVKILDAIAAMEAPKAATTQTTTQAATAPSVPAYFRGEPVFVTGGKAFKRDGKGKLTPFDHEAAKPYAWALAHDVRGAQQALGAHGCTDCHSSNAPLFESTVSSNAVLTSAITRTPMSRLRGDTNGGSMAAFAATYPMRPMLITTGYVCAVLLGLVLIAYTGRAVAAAARRRW